VHAVFVVLHLVALLFAGPLLLFITIPAHIIYAAIASRRPAKPNPWTHVKCPDCRELVLKDANVCKHCGCKLVPQT
jgi:uncharacterized paraquat-inducible protein A